MEDKNVQSSGFVREKIKVNIIEKYKDGVIAEGV